MDWSKRAEVEHDRHRLSGSSELATRRLSLDYVRQQRDRGLGPRELLNLRPCKITAILRSAFVIVPIVPVCRTRVSRDIGSRRAYGASRDESRSGRRSAILSLAVHYGVRRRRVRRRPFFLALAVSGARSRS